MVLISSAFSVHPFYKQETTNHSLTLSERLEQTLTKIVPTRELEYCSQKEDEPDEVENSTHLRSYSEINHLERNLIHELHAKVALAYFRVIVSGNIFPDSPYEDGYSLLQYFNDTHLAMEEWKKLSPMSDKFKRFHKILKRSFFCLKKFPNHRMDTERVVKSLKPSHETWIGILSNCAGYSARHWMVLKVKKTDAHKLDLTLVNVGYGYLRNSPNRTHCRDLVALNVDSKVFFKQLSKITKIRADVSEYYSLLRDCAPERTWFGQSRVLMEGPLCATETLRRCYQDFLGTQSYGRLMAFWTHREISQIETHYEKLCSFSHASPLVLKEAPSYLTTVPLRVDGTVMSNEECSSVRFLSQQDFDKFIENLSKTHLYYLRLTSPKNIKINLLNRCTQHLLGYTENDTDWILSSRKTVHEKKSHKYVAVK